MKKKPKVKKDKNEIVRDHCDICGQEKDCMRICNECHKEDRKKCGDECGCNSH